MVIQSKNGTRRTIPLNATVYEPLAAKQATTGAARGPVFRTPSGMNSKYATWFGSFARRAIGQAFQTPAFTTCGTRPPRA
jgi:hypothetical protein